MLNPDHPQRDYNRLRVLVMGLGSFGGGLGVVKFLAGRGASITITDARPAEKLTDAIAGLGDVPGLQYRLGGHCDEDFRSADLIVVNPAVRPDHPLLNLARSAGVPLTSEMNLFWQWNSAPVVAVTGSNGKSTTTALIHSILSKAGGAAWLGGNIGVSLLPHIEQIRPSDVVVLELSSFQLTDLDRLQSSPHVSVVTNFAPNHLDWHPTLDHYRWAKQTMLRWQTSTDFAVLNADDPEVHDWPGQGQRFSFSLQDTRLPGAFATTDRQAILRLPTGSQTLPLSYWLRLPGRHNLSNALAAVCAAAQFGVNAEAIQRGLEEYQPLPHRLQWIADVQGRSFYNDSLATTPESAIVGLQAFERPVVLLAGGYDKHVDLSQMAQAIASRAKAVALMGQTAGSLREGIGRYQGSPCVLSPALSTFREAFAWAFAQSEPGDVILLSPGCASYDWFRNFADRGQQFIELIEQLAGG
ncbi:MAG: UDP-N-acetylmuramoyl-L-alanine--D-glutamate ligase [Planctomycetes bacterium]|nr:UDP-N-acetylmuramoyl-L-alanine--D-glutamate ligase [Planctomycetota bacterium]